jgi:hypothetical protein
VSFPNAFLRIDGSGITAWQGAGVGTVNCQYYSPGTLPNNLADFEVFMTPQEQVVECIESFQENPHVFLRMDGSTVNGFSFGGSGTVNGQYYPSPGGGPGAPSLLTDYEALNIVFL